MGVDRQTPTSAMTDKIKVKLYVAMGAAEGISDGSWARLHLVAEFLQFAK